MYNGFTTTTTTTSGNSTRTTEQTVNYLGWITNNTDASGADVSYTYYSNGRIATMTTSGGVTVEMDYDDAGNRTSLDDPDYGEATSVYDAFGRIVRQNTPKNDYYDYNYDVLGRITRKYVYGDATTTLYSYNENINKGTVASISHNGQLLNYTYDAYCRLTSVDEIRRDTSYNTSYAYNNKSQIASITYPSGYQVYYEYYPNGTKKNIKDARGNTLWHTDDINAYGQLLQATTGNGAVTTNTYDIQTNRLVGSKTSNGIQNFSYTFDGFGNLTSRTDSLYSGKTETFTYDNLDRLTGITMNNLSSSIVYDALGRMTSKEKDGSIVFEYAQFGSTKPHATSSVQTKSQEFPDNQNIIYNSLDKVNRIAQGRKIVTFSYGYDAQRTKMIILDTVSNRTKTKDYVGSCEFVNDNGSKSVYTYLNGPYGVFAVVIKKGTTEEVNYIYKDHLGSWTTITDSVCGIVERRSFDAWGNLRDPQTWSGSPARPPKFDRGFTGHEHIYELGLINMNGRMYDPLMSAFLSPDNYMQDPTSPQGFNRYAYCMYNPLKYVDPSGEHYFGWDPSLEYRMEQEARAMVRSFWHQCYDSAIASHHVTMAMANCLYGHGPETHHNGSGNHGSPGGGQDGPNNKRPLIIIRTVTTDNDLQPIYNFLIFNSDESSGNNTSYFSELKRFVEENTKYFFTDVGEALDFMYENGFDENMNPYKEISAWVVDGGIIVQPWYDNTQTESINTYTTIDGKHYYEFQDVMFEIIAEIHTHVDYNNGNIGVSFEDLSLNNKIPVYIIYNSSLYKAGKPAIRLNQIRNINNYNWRDYFIY